jgi:hypothetical protein
MLLRAPRRPLGRSRSRWPRSSGGSLAHTDPTADWPAAMAALGADVIVHARLSPTHIARGLCGATAGVPLPMPTTAERLAEAGERVRPAR